MSALIEGTLINRLLLTIWPLWRGLWYLKRDQEDNSVSPCFLHGVSLGVMLCIADASGGCYVKQSIGWLVLSEGFSASQQGVYQYEQ